MGELSKRPRPRAGGGGRQGEAGWRKPRYTRSLPGWLARAFQLRILEPQAARGLRTLGAVIPTLA